MAKIVGREKVRRPWKNSRPHLRRPLVATTKWDLIVLSYVGAREYANQARHALRPGGMVIIEGFHRDATKTQSIGGAVVFDTNELLKLFADFRVVRYEDTAAVGDFGLTETRVVRLAAVKP